ncbi:MAG: hypothetical protein IKI84_00075 [Clostridia bacterium]|nr:hypothetical protein [Clostridia bacterium]
MREDYLDRVIRRGRELAVLEKAADHFVSAGSPALRWIVAGAFGLLAALFPSVSAARDILMNL